MQQKEFETLIRRIRRQLHREALRLLADNDEAEDVTQEAVLKLWAMRRQLDEYHSVEALAMVMVRRLSLSRKRTAATISLTDCQQTDVSNDASPEELLIMQEEEAKVMQLIATLPDAQQAILRMKHIDGLETSEIASITGSSEEAIRKNLSRARKRILKMFIR
jgi:RNA polymerase sigma-70 factor (ECF subfamily)